MTIREKLSGLLRLNRVPSDLCWGRPQDFLKRLTELLDVELDVQEQNEFVIVGHQVPSEDDKFKPWVRLGRDGRFMGLYLFQDGTWRRVHNYRNDEIVWMHGDSRNIPGGFELIHEGTGAINSSVVAHLMTYYERDLSQSGTVYRYFAVRYTGYF